VGEEDSRWNARYDRSKMPGISLRDRVLLRLQRHLTQPFDRRVRTPIRRLRNASREYQPIFVAGASGCGTSLLTLAIAQRFDCAGFVYEADAQISERSFLHVPPLASSFASVASYQRYIEPRESWSVEEGRRDLLDLFRSCGSGASDVMIVKGPDINLVRASFLNRCFPNARFLLIFRDPVVNVEGFRRKWPAFGNDALSETIRFYAETHEHFLSAAEIFPERVVAVEYEALVTRPDQALSKIGERFGLRPASRRMRLATQPNTEGKGIRNVRGGEIGVVTDANRRALERLDPAEVAEIRSALDPLYQRMCDMSFKIELGD
jgi:hypothetical protein